MKWWKWLGLAGLAGVTATGVVVARAERRRRAYTADEVRERLHQRVAEAADRAPSTTGGAGAAAARARRWGKVRIPLRRRPVVVHPESHPR